MRSQSLIIHDDVHGAVMVQCGGSHHLLDQMRSQWLIVTKSARCSLLALPIYVQSAAQHGQQWKEAPAYSTPVCA